VFYEEQWGELSSVINRVGIDNVSYDLFITLPDKNSYLSGIIKELYPFAQIHIVDNVGYDVGPFFYVLNAINLDNYAYIVKLHTKRRVSDFSHINYFPLTGYLWRKYLLSFVNYDNFIKTIDTLNRNKSIGMAASGKIILKQRYEPAIEIIQNMGLTINDLSFAAGTMFIVRAELFKILQNIEQLESFERPCGTEGKAHIYERIFGYIITAQGYTVSDFKLKNYKITEPLRKIKYKIVQKIRKCIYLD
jgi:lipopolysaccharide biosynthesis protein